MAEKRDPYGRTDADYERAQAAMRDALASFQGTSRYNDPYLDRPLRTEARARADRAQQTAKLSPHMAAALHSAYAKRHGSCDLDDRGEAAQIGALLDKYERQQTEDQTMQIPQSGEGDFELAPAGTHIGYCYHVIDLGTQQDSWQNQPKLVRKVLIQWELADAIMSDGRPFMVGKRYTFSDSRKGNLRKDLETWRGARFQDDEIARFQMNALLGHPAYLGLVHHQSSNGNTYCNVSTVMKAPRGTPVRQTQNERLFLSLEPGQFDQATYAKLSDGLRETIARSPEYQHVAGPPPSAPGGYRTSTTVWPQHPAAPATAQNGPLPDPGATPPAAAVQPASQAFPDLPPELDRREAPAQPDQSGRPIGGMGAELDDEVPF